MDEKQTEYFKQIGSDPKYWDDRVKTLAAVSRHRSPGFKPLCPCESGEPIKTCKCTQWAEYRKDKLKTSERV